MSQVREANKAQLESQLAVLQAKAERRHKVRKYFFHLTEYGDK
jgi:hypothetical protein